MTKIPTIAHPIYRLTFNWPLGERMANSPHWVWLSKFTLGYFGPSPAQNVTRRLIIFGWEVAVWQRMEWHDQTDKERADEYLSKWSECEKELQMFRLARLGEDAAPEVKRVIRESLGINLDEGTIR